MEALANDKDHLTTDQQNLSSTQSQATPDALEKRRELLLDALKTALATSSEQRLFRSGRLVGLFPSKHGDSGEAARQALAAGLLAHVRTEIKGQFTFDWVRPTPKAAAYVADHDSPKAILRELRDVLGETRAGVPEWMERTKSELRTLSNQFEQRASAMLNRLDSLALRVEDALRRAEATLPKRITGYSVEWAEFALEYLDKRREGGMNECPLSELFQAISQTKLDFTITEFHTGIRRLAEAKAIKLIPSVSQEPEFAVVFEGKLYQSVSR